MLEQDLSYKNGDEEKNFLNTIIKNDFSENGRCYGKTIHTRFPPEPNGYLHIGHAKAIYINFLMAEKYGGFCNLRMDDTNPEKEEVEYINSIKNDVKWLGFDYGDRFYYASDYFNEMFEVARNLIKKGMAYVCELTFQQTKDLRGDVSSPAKSPYRDRPIEESLSLFEDMRLGKFPNGKMTLRAKIDLSSPNFNMRDPVIYRIMHKYHHRTKDIWPIYPMYDFAHPIEDAIEGITHSLCSLEFEDHRPLYNWVIRNSEINENSNFKKIASKPVQIEFSRLNLDYTVMSKRKLKKIVDEKIVCGWDDPRLPTLSGIRNRGYSPESIKDFCSKIGISKSVSLIETKFLETCLRNDLNKRAIRVSVVIDPVKLIIENYPENKEENFKIVNNPTKNDSDSHEIIFTKEIYVERSDIRTNEEKNFFRIYPGSIVRLKSSYAVRCDKVDTDVNGNVSKVICTYFPETFGGKNIENVKIKSTVHWVSVKYSSNAEIRIYDKLFTVPDPEIDGDFIEKINKKSLLVYKNSKIERFLISSRKNEYYQFIRNGYFCLDKYSVDGNLVFNRSVALKESK